MHNQTNQSMTALGLARAAALGALAAASVLAPLSRIGDTEGARLVNGTVQLPDGYAEAYREMVEGGWISAEAPASAGGDGLPDAVRAALGEIWNSANAAFALSWLLTLWALLPYALGWPFALGMACAAAQIVWHFTLIRERSRDGCFVAFSKSHWIGASLFAGVALGFALR